MLSRSFFDATLRPKTGRRWLISTRSPSITSRGSGSRCPSSTSTMLKIRQAGRGEGGVPRSSRALRGAALRDLLVPALHHCFLMSHDKREATRPLGAGAGNMAGTALEPAA